MFRAGVNALVITPTNGRQNSSNPSGPCWFRTAVVVTAAAVAIPTALPLLMLALGGLGFAGRLRNKS